MKNHRHLFPNQQLSLLPNPQRSSIHLTIFFQKFPQNLSKQAPIVMPLYEIQHTTPLSEPQREALAKVITKIHTRAFTVPSLLVNVRFIDTTSLAHYVAGKQVCSVFFLSWFIYWSYLWDHLRTLRLWVTNVFECSLPILLSAEQMTSPKT